MKTVFMKLDKQKLSSNIKAQMTDCREWQNEAEQLRRKLSRAESGYLAMPHFWKENSITGENSEMVKERSITDAESG